MSARESSLSSSPVLPSILVVARERGQHPSVQSLRQRYRTLVVHDRGEALEMARRELPDLIVAEVEESGWDAAEWVAEIRRDPLLTTIPVLVVGAPQSDQSDTLRALAAGADDCLTGPLAPDVLRAKVAVLLARRSAELRVFTLNEKLEARVARTEAELIVLRKRLEDASQMEAIGRLAGGVAHNFNNLLTVILVSSEMLMAQLPPGSVEWLHAHETHEAGTRAAALTGQLLAFSGRQMLRPVDLDLNVTLAEMAAVLPGVLGDQVELKISAEDGVPPVRVDSSQMRRVIMDLATHAREAMPHGGTVIVETRRVVLTDAYVAQHVNVQPGVYVLLAISDTGPGMDPETQLHLFEPFFAQNQGKGSGLGLSAVYGIVKQSGGHIWVYSEPGHGTTFKIYLPEAHTQTRPDSATIRRRQLPRGRASVLLVEDEPGVRAVASRVLESCGYTVVTASSGEEALARCLDRGLEPDLLITDVVMSGISGSQLVARLRSRRDDLRVLYTSGFTEDAVVHHGVAAGEHFLSKPFTPADLAHKVREALGVTDDVV